jgi:hypothetical protein
MYPASTGRLRIFYNKETKVSYFSFIQLSVYTVKCRKFDTGLLYVKIAVNVGNRRTAAYPM